MTMIETIIQDWCDDLTDQLDAEAHLLGVADRGVLRESFSHWIVNDLRFLVGDALDSAHQGLLTAHGPTEAVSILRAEAASGPSCDLLSSVFPAATSLLANRLTTAATAIRELLRRYVDDKESLDTLGWDGPVTSIEVGLSDSHAGGRQVAMVQSTGGHRVVYKPRPHQTDIGWNRIANAMNGLSKRHVVDVVPVLDRGDYGWSSYCESLESPEFTDERGEQIGAVLAVLHHLGSTDMHRENLVFTDTGPAILDTETIASWPTTRLIPGDPAATAATVLDTSAVASWTVSLEGHWTSIAPIHDLIHHGSPARTEVDRRLARVADGYRLGSQLLAQREMNAAIAALASIETRLITRRTSVYARLLRESVRGHSLRSATRRSEIIAKLEPWATHDEVLMNQIVSEERACATAGDIPRFLIASDGTVRTHRRVLGILDGASERAEAISRAAPSADTEAQIKVVRAALRPISPITADRADLRSFTASAQLLIDDLTSRLAEVDGQTRAIGGVLDPLKFAAAVGPLGRGLYNGRSGVALALGASQLAVHIPGIDPLVRSLLVTRDHGIDEADHHGLVGPSSDAYAYSITHGLLGVRNSQCRHAAPSRAHDPLPEVPDIIDGVAGEALSRISTSTLTRPTASTMLTALNDLWTNGDGLDLTHLGMAHGSLGSSFAAVRLAHHIGDGPQLRTWQERFRSASDAVAETSMAQAGHESVSWCRGLAGLVAAHLELHEVGAPSRHLPAWIAWLLEHHQLAVGQALCCGAGALADVIATMRRRRMCLPSSADATLRHWLRQPQNPRLPATQPHIGFMQGTSGTLYTLVRLIPAGQSLPSVLTFGSIPK